MKKHSWHTFSAAPHTLLDALAEHLTISRSRAKVLLDQRNVFVNGKRVWMARHRLKAGDLIEVVLPPNPQDMATVSPAILLDQLGVVIADKPAGILSNGANSLEARLQQLLRRPKLEALHRLDRDTTGCLMFCDDAALREDIIRLFAARHVTKIYHAIVTKRPDFTDREIRQPLDGKPAVTHMRVLDANAQGAHLQIKIETGRTHQIRRHLTALALPLLGDRQYVAHRRLTAQEMLIPRQMLHARRLMFLHPTAQTMVNATAPLPADFRHALALLKLR